MKLDAYIAANPLPSGTTRFGMPAPPMDCLDLCYYATAQLLAAELQAALAASGLTPAPGQQAPAIVDGGGSGNMSVNDDVLVSPPTAPYVATSLGFFGFYGFVVNSQPINTGDGVIAPGTVMLVDESIGRLNARGQVDPQGVPAGSLGSEVDKNFVVSPSGQRRAVWTNLAFQVGLGGIVEAFWMAPA